MSDDLFCSGGLLGEPNENSFGAADNRLSGGSGLIERDQISVGVEDSELVVSPWRFGQRGIGVHYSVTQALGIQGFNSLDADSATSCLSNPPISTCPKVNADGAARHNAVGPLIGMNFDEAKLGTKELDASLDIQRGQYWGCNDELDGLWHKTTAGGSGRDVAF